jgi:hypothetical protein
LKVVDDALSVTLFVVQLPLIDVLLAFGQQGIKQPGQFVCRSRDGSMPFRVELDFTPDAA